MQITKINTAHTFARTPLMTCTVKKQGSQEKVQATLYKMDPNNSKDLSDIKYSKLGYHIYSGALRESEEQTRNREFFMLQNDKTSEVISCAQTSHRYRTSDKNPGFSTLIEELGVSDKYINGAEPMLALIARNAFQRFDSSVYSAIHPDDLSCNLKHAKFTQSKLGEWFIPEKRFDLLVDTATKRSQIEFLG